MDDVQLKKALVGFGHEDFREKRREPIEAVLRGEDVEFGGDPEEPSGRDLRSVR